MNRAAGVAFFLLGVIIGLILLSYSLILFNMTYIDGYRQGQIDALTGKAKYHLVTLPDSTRVWEMTVQK